MMGDEKMEFKDTNKTSLQCRFCKETSELGVWMPEAPEPEETFICKTCWDIIASLIYQLLIPALRENLQFAENRLKACSVIRGVKVEATPR